MAVAVAVTSAVVAPSTREKNRSSEFPSAAVFPKATRTALTLFPAGGGVVKVAVSRSHRPNSTCLAAKFAPLAPKFLAANVFTTVVAWYSLGISSTAASAQASATRCSSVRTCVI